MLNTIPITIPITQINPIKNNQEIINGGDIHQPSIIEKMANETIIDEGIRKIEENSMQTGIANSFHNLESKIFANAKTITEIDHIEELIININDDKFVINDINNKQMGYFTIDHIIKYLSDPFDTQNQVLNEINEDSYQKGKELIKSLIFKLVYNKKNGKLSIIIIDYTKSRFMSNIELLVKLNDMLYKYQETQLTNLLSSVDKKNKEKIEDNIKKFIYQLLNYTLKLISKLSEKLKDIEDKKELKQNLIKYSASLVYKINTFINDQLKKYDSQNENIKQLLKYNIEIKENIKEKVNKILTKIEENQNKTSLKTSKFNEI
ncbi:hypothetical protein Indivirus_1_92 [Indivirus ILV1]|uniref:Uncharacterized protein n=1 Tax=Indivirus ILV1 TaxID=1977633 RepID=A0A1V0SCN5_9VIRU|nr:hypothetical protein Indivirus_1_92 [Indivirus ILV1]